MTEDEKMKVFILCGGDGSRISGNPQDLCEHFKLIVTEARCPICGKLLKNPFKDMVWKMDFSQATFPIETPKDHLDFEQELGIKKFVSQD